MEKRDNSRVRSNLISFVVLIAAIYVILITIFVVTLYRLTVTQSAKIQTLEAVAAELAARVDKLETSFTAQRSDETSVGDTDREGQEKTKNDMRLTNKADKVNALKAFESHKSVVQNYA